VITFPFDPFNYLFSLIAIGSLLLLARGDQMQERERGKQRIQEENEIHFSFREKFYADNGARSYDWRKRKMGQNKTAQ
jgi:hypothetical protein